MVWLLALLIAAPLLVFSAHLTAMLARCKEMDEKMEHLLRKVRVEA